MFEINTLKSDHDITKSIKLKKVFKGHKGNIVALKMDENFVLTGSEDSTARLFDKLSGRCLFSILNRNVALTAVDMNDKLIITGYADGVIDIYCKLTGIILGSFKEHTDRINKVKIVHINNYPDVILSASNDCTAKLIFDGLKHIRDDIEKPHLLMSDYTLKTIQSG